VESAAEAPRPKRQGKVIDMMQLLRQSVEQAQSKEGSASAKRVSAAFGMQNSCTIAAHAATTKILLS
jgi:non-homologous end joining protein Ku